MWMPYWGRSLPASWGALLPSTRALGHVPLTGEVDKPRRKERAPVFPEDTNEHLTDQQPRCGITKILTAEGECLKLGEIQLGESLLCEAHAELLRLGERSEVLLGEVFKMDGWLENADGETDELRVRRVEHHRNELVEQFRFNRMRIDLIRGALLEEKDGMT
jgi:hypothetical protein